MRDGCVDNLLERFLSFDLLVQNTKCNIFEVDNKCILAIKLDFFLDYAEHKLFLILLFVSCKINVCLYSTLKLGCIVALEQLFLYKLFSLLKDVYKVLLSIFHTLWLLAHFALILEGNEFYTLRRDPVLILSLGIDVIVALRYFFIISHDVLKSFVSLHWLGCLIFILLFENILKYLPIMHF